MGCGGRRTLVAALVAVGLLAGACVGPTDDLAAPPADLAEPEESGEAGEPAEPTALPAGEPRPQAERRPNIVLVLMDDFSMDLLPTMRSAEAMARRGASYPHSFVVDSLCCVSRSSLFTGQYPHQTGVRTNSHNTADPARPLGGYDAFAAYGNLERTFAVRLEEAGYTTGFVGKFLNRYEYVPGGVALAPPPGWSDFDVVYGSAYDGWDFYATRTEDGVLETEHHPAPAAEATAQEKDAAYAGTVIADRALDFVAEHRDDADPWFLEVAPYGPHSRVGGEGAWPGEPVFPPAFRDRPGTGHAGNCGRLDCLDLGVDDLRGYGDDRADNAPVQADGSTPPAWNPAPVEVAPQFAVRQLRDRARMAQSIDRMVLRLLRSVPPDTYVVLTSDNGFHVGQHGLGIGKGAAYDSDIRVPLLVVGPGVRPGERPELVSNIDLAPTFEDLAGLAPAPFRSGRSFAATLHDPALAARQHYAFVEHTWSRAGDDPDQGPAGTLDLVPSYVAVRSRDALLIRYDLDPDPTVEQHAWEFYDYTEMAFEQTNTYTAPRHRVRVAELTRKLEQFDRCSVAVRDDAVPRECRDLAQ